MNMHPISGSKLSSFLLILALVATGLGAASGAASAAPSGSKGPGGFYYYADGQRVPLQVSLKWAAVQFTDANPRQQAEALAAARAPLDASAGRRDLPGTGLSLLPVAAGATEQGLVQSLRSMRQTPGRFQNASPVFEGQDAEMMLTDEFIAGFDARMSRSEIERVNARHGVSLGAELLGQHNTFILHVAPGSELDALEMSNLYQESGEALSAAPNFVLVLARDPAVSTRAAPASLLTTTPNDPMFSDQWALHNTQQYGSWMSADDDIKAPGAWGYTTGDESVVIAVIDEGVELTHEDLSAKLVAGYDATGLGSAGAPCAAPCGNDDDTHGTAVAGLAAATTNNSLGAAGVCPACSIMPVRIARGDGSGNWITTNAIIADGISWAYLHEAWILNLSFIGPSNTAVTTAINNAKALGRGGKGSVVIGAAGNAGSGTVSYPASLAGVIAVGALNMCNARKTATYDQCNVFEDYWGSNYGTALDISAPGVWLDTADRMGGYGLAVGNYIDFFNGSSGATPLVSGVAGLMLSVNPDLTAAQVQSVMQSSADDLGAAGRDNQTGWGRLDAEGAVVGAMALQVKANVTIGGTLMGSYYLPSSSSARGHYSGLDSGPVVVASSDGIMPLVAAIRDLWSDSTHETSSVQVMGLPASLLSTSYYFPAYNNVSLDDQIRFGNVGTAPTNVTVTIGGTAYGPYYLLPSQSQRVSYAGVDSGPVVVSSSGGVKIIASIRDSWWDGTRWTSYSQLMGLPASQLSTIYHFPAYENVGALDGQLRFGNVGSSATWVTVTIGGAEQGSYWLAPSASVRVSYAGLDSGPVKIESSGGVPIIASLRDSWWDGSVWTSYSQLMGLPNGQLSASYYFPAYNNVSLDDQLRIGRP